MTPGPSTGRSGARVASPALLLAAVVGLGCPPQGLPDGLGDCPDDSSVVWASVEPILTVDCAGCHASTRETAEERQDAPEGVDFDTADAAAAPGWLAWSQIQRGLMPKEGELPREDALLLWEWWSCGGPP